jgi:hypothetical protein
MKLYENIVIGNFLFALGYAIRDKKRIDTLKCSINLLQQTPADCLLGDVLTQFPGTARLIEFKAQGARLDKEEGRHRTLTHAIGATGFEAISRDIHWYIESAADEEAFRTRFVPYLDAFSSPDEPQRQFEPKGQFLEIFIDKLACEVAEGNVRYSQDSIRAYLDWVRRTLGSGAVSSGGLLLVVQPNGALVFAPMRDLMELNLHHSEWLLQRNNPERTIKLERERKFSRERRIERDGPSQGMER